MPDLLKPHQRHDGGDRTRCRGADARRKGPAFESPELRKLLEATVAGGFDIEEDDLRKPTRGEARIALARQVAMYLAHVGCGLSKAEAGRLFHRDRTTVHHACIVVEGRRDDDQFDLALEYLEQIIRIVVGAPEGTCIRCV